MFVTLPSSVQRHLSSIIEASKALNLMPEPEQEEPRNKRSKPMDAPSSSTSAKPAPAKHAECTSFSAAPSIASNPPAVKPPGQHPGSMDMEEKVPATQEHAEDIRVVCDRCVAWGDMPDCAECEALNLNL